MKILIEKINALLGILVLTILPIYAYQIGEFCPLSQNLCPSIDQQSKADLQKEIEKMVQQPQPQATIGSNAANAKTEQFLEMKQDLKEKIDEKKSLVVLLRTIAIALYALTAYFVFRRFFKST